MQVAIATTTIFSIQEFLESYCTNLRQFGHQKYTKIYIAGDRKSPPDSSDTAAEFRKDGFDVVFMDIECQQDYLSRFPDLAAIIPEN